MCSMKNKFLLNIVIFTLLAPTPLNAVVTVTSEINRLQEQNNHLIIALFVSLLLFSIIVSVLTNRSTKVAKLNNELNQKKHVENYIKFLSHQVGSHTTVIISAAEALLNRKLNADKSIEYLKKILRRGKEVNTLTIRLLELAKIDQKISVDNTDSFNLTALIYKTIGDFYENLSIKNISIIFDKSAITNIKSDKILTQQAFENILNNAIDFSPKNGSINIGITKPNNWIEISVLDQGCGIPEYAKSKIFEKYYSTDRPDTNQKGNGLGLQFVKKIMKLHNGNITIDNRKDISGVVAILRFPQ
jgi:two-component system, OmpR family, sensor histidine kinase CreC